MLKFLKNKNYIRIYGAKESLNEPSSTVNVKSHSYTENETYRGCSFGTSIRRTRYAEGLLRLRLIRSLLALHTFVQRSVQIRSRFAYRQRTFFYRRRTHIRCRSANRTRLTGGLNTLSSVTSSWAGFAFSFDSQLLSRATLVSAFFSRHSFCCSSSFTQAAQQTRETTLVRLIETMAATSTETSQVVVVFSSGTLFLAIGCASSTWSHRYARTSCYHRTGTAFQLT